VKNPLTRAPRVRDGLPVLPGDFPLVGHLPALSVDPVAVIREGHRELGPLFWLSLGFGAWVLDVAGSPGLEVLKSKQVTSAHFQEKAPILFGECLAVKDGRPHQHIRSAMAPTFLPRGLAEGRLGLLTAELIEARVRRWLATGSVVVLDETRALTLEIILRMVGIPAAELAESVAQYRKFLLAGIPVALDLPGSPARIGRGGRDWLNARLGAALNAARTHGSNSLLGLLSRARDDDGQPLSDAELLDNLRFLTLAGHETSSSVMAWMLILLAQRPELWDGLVAEVERRPSLPGAPEELRHYPFAEALFRETLRCYPPIAATSRQTTEGMTLHGRPVPAGTYLQVALALLAQDPELYPDPERFEVGRWLGRSAPPTGIETIVFGYGPHFCLGYHLALMEGVQYAVALALLVGRAGRRPRLARSARPRHVYFPVFPAGHPSPGTRVELR
jgi:cytochrome P450 family 117 subfamily A